MEPGSIGNLRTEAIVSVECANWHIGHAAIRLTDFYRVKISWILIPPSSRTRTRRRAASDLDLET